MASTLLRQRLTPILAADAVAYSRLMGSDERATVAALEAARQVFRAEIDLHDGRVIDMAGDSVLAVFDSVNGALDAAIAIQETLHRALDGVAEERRMRFRIGVHLGDVFEKPDGTIYGDGVNIAARLESLADAGGIAVSDAVERAMRGKVAHRLRYHGPQRLKNVLQPVDLYTVELPWQPRSSRRTAETRGFKRIMISVLAASLLGVVGGALLWTQGSSPDRDHAAQRESPLAQNGRSVAVLPFADLSEGRDQSYFSDGLSEEVISRLTQIPRLRVIARTSSFSFKDSHASAAEIARQLNVATLLEGSVRRSGDRIRVSAQLVRAADNSYLWSGAYERKLTDIFAIQDEIANAVVAALQVNLGQSPQAAPARYLPKPDAYDQYLLGRQLLRTRPDHYQERAVEAFSRAVAIDEHYAAAYSMLAFAISFVAENAADPHARQTLMDQALAAAEKAVSLGPTETDAFATRGFLRFEARWDCAGADTDLRKAMQLDPTAEPTMMKYAYFLAAMGHAEEALALAQRLKSTDPFFPPPWELESQIQASRGDYNAAEASLRHAHSILRIDPESGEGLARLALLKGEPARAKALFAKVRDPAHRDWGLALVEHDQGHPRAVRSALQTFVAKSPYEYYNLAVAYAYAHQPDAAFDALERAYETHDPSMQLILIDPLLASLHADQRYSRLIARMGCPAPALRQG